MKSCKIFSFLMALMVSVAAQSCCASYLLEARAEAYYAGEGHTPNQVDHGAGNVFVASEAELTIGGTTARAIATSDFNKLGAFARVVASLPELNDTMGGAASASWKDTLIFERDGVRLNSGTVRVSADIDGTISLSGDGAGARATLNLSASFSKLIAGESVKEVSFTEAGSYQDLISFKSTGEWDSVNGLPVQLQLYLGGGNNSSSPSTTEVDFDSTATITSVAYLTPDGLPDPTVTITSSSGVVYGVPEPSSIALGMMWLGCASGRFRRRF